MANKKGFGTYILYFLPILIGGGVFFYYYQKNKKDKAKKAANNSSTNSGGNLSTNLGTTTTTTTTTNEGIGLDIKPPKDNTTTTGNTTTVSTTFGTTYYVKTSTKPLNVRQKPSANATLVGSLPKGSQIFGRPSGTNGWIEVSKDGKTTFGFASSTYLSTTK